MSGLNILVVGASIAGPMTAYWLTRAGAASVTVIERFPSLRTGGQNVDIRLSGVSVMRKIPGFEATVREHLAPLTGLGFVRADGTPIATMTQTGDAENQSLVSEYEIFRGDLSRLLYDLTKDHPRVKYIFGEQVSKIEQLDLDTDMITEQDTTGQEHASSSKKVRVTFANGTEPASYDLVVACDGATSRTRALGLGCGVRDHILPVGAWCAYFDTRSDLLNGSTIGVGYSAPGGRALTIGPKNKGSNIAVSMNSAPSGDHPDMLAFRAASAAGPDAVKRLVAERCAGMGWRAEELMAEMQAAGEQSFYASEWCQVKVPSLHRGGFVLAGDAGHAAGPTGAGTSLAMTAGYILAGELLRHKGDIGAGLRAYEDRIQPLVKDGQVIPPGVLSFMTPQTQWGIWVRDQIFKAVCFGMQYSWAFSWLSAWSPSFGKDKSELPNYEWVE
ncbi:hypothetical protein I316_05131 [Kwoniella heveanensis BCC8398]|uniref:FAD-binding domain-containing protein n=1 Tax=Kwoniella heveanensis BCC8398 TaxID=1296120 RepID=A0A1B9GQ05_9TREE|nr:hypothetical protein I316_05131 [Kwoniella heveanensis BCC8398]